jgi:hypothetical protein
MVIWVQLINSHDEMRVLRILAYSDFSVAGIIILKTEVYLSYLMFARSCHLGVKREEGLQVARIGSLQSLQFCQRQQFVAATFQMAV